MFAMRAMWIATANVHNWIPSTYVALLAIVRGCVSTIHGGIADETAANAIGTRSVANVSVLPVTGVGDFDGYFVDQHEVTAHKRRTEA